MHSGKSSSYEQRFPSFFLIYKMIIKACNRSALNFFRLVCRGIIILNLQHVCYRLLSSNWISKCAKQSRGWMLWDTRKTLVRRNWNFCKRSTISWSQMLKKCPTQMPGNQLRHRCWIKLSWIIERYIHCQCWKLQLGIKYCTTKF